MGLFSNPLNWAVTDTIQGQQGGWTVDNSVIGRTGAAANSFQGASSPGPVFSNPSGVVNASSSPSQAQQGGSTNTNQQDAQQPQIDPYAAAQAAAMGAARNNFNAGRNTLFGSVNRAGDSKASQYDLSIDQWLNSTNADQSAVNAKGVNAEMARNQGVSGIRSMVGNGIKSAGVMLANKNAGSSSAAGALANAYGQLGQRQMQGVGNQYGQAQNQIGIEQQTVDSSRALQKKTFDVWKNDNVNSIVESAQQEMGRLNEAAANASLPDRIAIEQEVERIRSEAMGKLQAFDAKINTYKQATSRDQRMTEGNRLLQEGMGGDNPYQFTTENYDPQFQYQAPAGGGLPIYTYNNKNKYTA